MPGTWRQGGLADDKEDLIVIVEFLKRQYGYVTDLIVGHSHGSAVVCLLRLQHPTNLKLRWSFEFRTWKHSAVPSSERNPLVYNRQTLLSSECRIIKQCGTILLT